MYDLNVQWPATAYSEKPLPIQLLNLQNTLIMLNSFGYNHIAINFIIDENDKIPTKTPEKLNPIPMNELREKTKSFKDLKLFSRATIVISDPSKSQSVSKLSSCGMFDLIAVQPTTEKALQMATTNLDIDIISLPMATRLPYFLKHKTIGQAVEKGIKFEICYAGLIAGPAGYESAMTLGTTGHISRKNFIGNCLQLIRASRNRGLVLSSGALEPLHVRNNTEILALMDTLGHKVSKGKEAFTKNPQECLVAGRLRIKSNKQTVMLGQAIGTSTGASTIIDEPTPRNALASSKRTKESVSTSSKRQKI